MVRTTNHEVIASAASTARALATIATSVLRTLSWLAAMPAANWRWALSTVLARSAFREASAACILPTVACGSPCSISSMMRADDSAGA